MSLMSLMSPMRKILFAVIGLSLLSGCMDMDDATQPVTAVVQLERPSGFVNLTDLSGHTVTLKSATETMTAVTDASGRATFTDLAPDIYDISMSADVSGDQYKVYTGQNVDPRQKFMMTGSLSQQSLTVDGTITLSLTSYEKPSIIIGKVYPSYSKIDGGTYHNGKYVELYNNSDETVDAAGLYLGLLEAGSSIAYKVYPYEEAVTPGILHLKQVFRIPADQPVLMAPGGTLLLVNSATNHSTQNQWERDLRQADFEAKDASNVIPNNNDVPALELVFSNNTNISEMNLVQGGPTSLVIFRTGEDVERTWPIVYGPNMTSGTRYMELNASYVQDGVDIIKNRANTGPQINDKRLFQDIDAGYTYVLATGGTAGERLLRKTASVTADGRKVLQDTNNSSNDFVCSEDIDPRNYLEP